MSEKKRLDVLLFEKGLAASREKARALIMSGNVYVDNQKSDKPGTTYKDDVSLEVRETGLGFVSRGGLKLNKAIKTFKIDLRGLVAMDIGASTGGFTDCMLQNGAARVYSVDVGYGQLDWKLRNDDRVVNMERTNIRYIDREKVPKELDFISIDVSFISLCLVLPVAKSLMKDGAKAVCLIKPQFEAGRGKVGKNGVVRDPQIHVEVIEKIKTYVLDNGFKILGLDFSPVKGPKGNIEYLIYLENSGDSDDLSNKDAKTLVKIAHEALNFDSKDDPKIN